MQAAQESGLSASMGADETDDLAGVSMKFHPGQYRTTIEGKGDVLRLDHRGSALQKRREFCQSVNDERAGRFAEVE